MTDKKIEMFVVPSQDGWSAFSSAWNRWTKKPAEGDLTMIPVIAWRIAMPDPDKDNRLLVWPILPSGELEPAHVEILLRDPLGNFSNIDGRRFPNWAQALDSCLDDERTRRGRPHWSDSKTDELAD